MARLVHARPRVLVGLAALIVLVVLSQATVLAATVITKGVKPQQLKAASADSSQSRQSTSWANMPDMQLTMKVAKGKAVFVITLSAASTCQSSATGVCLVRILANGQLVQPGAVWWGYAEADHGSSGGAHSMQFVTPELPAGTYLFTAQWSSDSQVNFFLNQRTMTVLRTKA